MKKAILLLFFVIFFINSYASDHGIYLHTVSNIQGDMDNVKSDLLKTLSSSEFKVVAAMDIKTSDYVREDTSEYCGWICISGTPVNLPLWTICKCRES